MMKNNLKQQSSSVTSKLIEATKYKNKEEVNEIFAVTAIKLATKMGKKIPEDLSIIGFTDGIISKYSSPSITTISQNGVKMGEKAAKMLIERLESEIEQPIPGFGKGSFVVIKAIKFNPKNK